MSAGSAYTVNRSTVARLALITFIFGAVFLSLPHAPSYDSIRHYASSAAHPSQTPQPPEAAPQHPQDVVPMIPSFYDACVKAPDADKVLVMLKTGATELYQKLPTHFVTTFTCTPHFLLFSDLAQNFADYLVHDALASVSASYRDNHVDFELYRKLEKYQREGQDLAQLSGGGGWNLDKWKFLPMLFQAFESAGPQIEWFFMMEADTSVSWPNLLLYLRTMDPRKPFYLGSQNVIGSTTFAHGGSGVVISRKAADLMLAHRAEVGKQAYDAKWEEMTSTSCCGDEVIARALSEAGVDLTPSWPLIQGETVSSIDWTEKHWCSPAITWHHVSPIEVDSMFRFQAEWVEDHGWETPFLHSDVFEHFIARHVSVNRTQWNNLSKDTKLVSPSMSQNGDKEFSEMEDYERAAVDSEEACAAACEKSGECIQWMFTPGRCYLGNDIRFGKSDEVEGGDGDHWVSGWSQERMNAFKKRMEGCKVNWGRD